MADKLGPYELNSIITGDARELSRAIPDNSVDLIFTDPVYDRIEDYEWLAETAARVLKDDRACLVFCGIGYLRETIKALDTMLKFRWQFAVMQFGSPTLPSKRFFQKGFNKWHTCLWYENGNSCPNEHIADTIISTHPGDDNRHQWMKAPHSYYHWLGRFTKFDQIILDPFTGGGTVPAVCKMLNRQYLAFEIDPETADLARQRVLNTQPPLPLIYHEQTSLLAREAKK